MVTTPKLADVSCTAMQFKPGDKILVRSRVVLDNSQRKQLKRTVERWAGDYVEVLVVDPITEVVIDRQNP